MSCQSAPAQVRSSLDNIHFSSHTYLPPVDQTIFSH
ncbi:unnamed protein product, partial [Staurois parvus]